MWSLTTPTFCMNAYTLGGPTKRYPWDFNSLANASACGVDPGELCEGPRRALTGALVGPHERRQARRRGPHRARVLDGGLDLGAVTDDRGILQQPVDVSLR